MTKIKPVNKRKNVKSALTIIDNTVRHAYDKLSAPISTVVDGLSDVLGVIGKSTSDAIDQVINFPQLAMDSPEKKYRAREIRYTVKDPKFQYLLENGVHTGITKDGYVRHITNGETPTWDEFKRKKLETAGILDEILDDDLKGVMKWQKDLMDNSAWSYPMTPVEIAKDRIKVNAQDIIMPNMTSVADMYFDMGGQGEKQRPVKLIIDDNYNGLAEYRNNERTKDGYQPRIYLNLSNIADRKQMIEDARFYKTMNIDLKTKKIKSAKQGYYGDGVIAHEMQHYLDHNTKTKDPDYLSEPHNYYYKQLLEQKAHAAEASAEWRLANKRYPFKDKDVDGVYEVYLRKIQEEGVTQGIMPKKLFKILFRTVADNNNTEQDLKDILNSKENFA